MKLLQMNIWGGRLEHQLQALVAQENPDIICFQEAVDLAGGNSGFFLTLDDLPTNLGLINKFMAPVYTFDYMKRKLDFGNAILSKLPILSHKTVFTSHEYTPNFDMKDGKYNVRNFQHSIIDIGDKKVHILNHHGYHIPHHKDGDDETMRQCKQIADYIKLLEGSIILTGDFNLSPKSKSLEQINAILTNLSVEAGLTTTRTELTKKQEVCDYIFVNDEVDVRSFKASNFVASDHQALILEFK